MSFMKILTDDAVNSWKYNIHYCILNSCGKLVQLCALHMKRDNPYLLELLAIVLDPDNKFNTFNASRTSDQYINLPVTSGNGNVGSGGGGGSVSGGNWGNLEDIHIYAVSPTDPKSPRGWLVDLINR